MVTIPPRNLPATGPIAVTEELIACHPGLAVSHWVNVWTYVKSVEAVPAGAHSSSTNPPFAGIGGPQKCRWLARTREVPLFEKFMVPWATAALKGPARINRREGAQMTRRSIRFMLS
jgi:hypothetical protein